MEFRITRLSDESSRLTLMTLRYAVLDCLYAGAVYADVLCHCVNMESLPCVSRCSQMPAEADGDDDDVIVMSRRGATTSAGAETAALSTVLAVSPFTRSGTNPCCSYPQSLPTSFVSGQMTTMVVTVDSHDVIEMQRMND